MFNLHSLIGFSLQETHQDASCTRMITQGNHVYHDHYFVGGRLVLEPKGDKASFIVKPTSLGLLGRPILNSQLQGPLRPSQGQGLIMAHSKQPLTYLEQIQGWAPAMQKETFSLTVYSMGVRTIEESLGVEGKFFNSRTGSFKLSDPECITAVLDVMEAITSIPSKRIRVMDVRGFKDAGHVLKSFWHIGTHRKSVNMSALDPAMGRWVSMVVGHLLAGVKDIFRNGAPNCLVLVVICTGGRHQSVMCTKLVHRLASMQGIDCSAVHLCQGTWGRICSTCEHCSWNSAPKCDLAKLRDQNLRNIIELIQNNLLRSLGASAQMTYIWKQVLPNAKLNRSLKKWTETERIAEVEAAAGSGSKAATTAARSGKQPKGANGSSSAAAAPASTAKSKAAAAPAATPVQWQSLQKE